MDNFSETLVKHKLSPDDKKKVKLIFFALIICSLIFILALPLYFLKIGIPLAPTASMIVFGVIVFLFWRTLKNMVYEFEYIITEGILDVDKIISKKKRVRLISFDLKEIGDIGIYDKHAFANKHFDTVIHSERDENGSGNYFLTVYHKDKKNTLVIFSPDDKMLEMLKLGIPRNMINRI